MSDKMSFRTPVTELRWVYINGKPKEDLNGNKRWSATAVLTEDQAKELQAKVNEFWEANKPKGARKPKSNGLYRAYKLEGEDKVRQISVCKPLDDDMEPVDEWYLQAWTSTTWPDGNPKAVPLYNAKGKRIRLPSGVRPGNGTKGRLAVTAAIYDNGANKGVTLYLDGVQITHFVEYAGDVSFDEAEGDFENYAGDFDEEPEGAAPPEADKANGNDDDVPFEV